MERHRLTNLEAFSHYWNAVIEHIPQAEQQMCELLDRKLPYASSIYEVRSAKTILSLHAKKPSEYHPLTVLCVHVYVLVS